MTILNLFNSSSQPTLRERLGEALFTGSLVGAMVGNFISLVILLALSTTSMASVNFAWYYWPVNVTCVILGWRLIYVLTGATAADATPDNSRR